MKKKCLSIMLVAAMTCTTLLSACGSSGSSTASTTSSESKSESSSSEATGEMPNLVVSFTYGNIPTDIEMVEEAINKITVDKIGATVTLVPYTYGNIQDQMTLTLASQSEQLDVLLGLFRNGLTGAVSKGQLKPLDDLLAEYGTGIIDAVGQEYIDACKINGQIYAVTTNRNLAGQTCIMFKKAIIDDLGIDLSTVKTYDDLTPVFEKIRKAYPEMSVTASSGTKPSFIINNLGNMDKLSDFLGVLMNYNDLKVSNLFESSEYRELVLRMKEWNKAGYIYPDITTDSSNAGAALLKSGTLASYFTSYKPGAVVEGQISAGTELVSVVFEQPIAITSSVQTWAWTIPENSIYPEKAMEFLNLLYTDADMVDLLSYGVKDYHWVLDKDGFATDGPYTDGYADKATWKSGNAFLAPVWNGDSADLWTQLKAFNTDAAKSKALGFSFDATNVSTEYTAMASVTSEYRMMLEWGFVDDVDASLKKFNEALYDAGLQTYMDEKQKQLDEWSAKK